MISWLRACYEVKMFAQVSRLCSLLEFILVSNRIAIPIPDVLSHAHLRCLLDDALAALSER